MIHMLLPNCWSYTFLHRSWYVLRCVQHVAPNVWVSSDHPDIWRKVSRWVLWVSSSRSTYWWFAEILRVQPGWQDVSRSGTKPSDWIWQFRTFWSMLWSPVWQGLERRSGRVFLELRRVARLWGSVRSTKKATDKTERNTRSTVSQLMRVKHLTLRFRVCSQSYANDMWRNKMAVGWRANCEGPFPQRATHCTAFNSRWRMPPSLEVWTGLIAWYWKLKKFQTRYRTEITNSVNGLMAQTLEVSSCSEGL